MALRWQAHARPLPPALRWAQKHFSFDRGFLNFARFDQLSEAGVFFLTRKELRVVVRTEQVLRATDVMRDQRVQVGSAKNSQCKHPLRMVEWHHPKWYQYLTNVLEPAALYHYRIAHHRGKTEDPVAYLAADAKVLGIIKQEQQRRSAASDLLYLTIPDSS